MSTTNAHKVLGIPELLHRIFGGLDNATNATNARVCRQWHELALDSIWYDVRGLYSLFNCLSPMEVDGERCAFKVVPDSQSWANFSKYARRVRRLSCSNFHLVRLQRSVFLDIARTRPRDQNILPNMQMLTWDDNPEFATLFMHSRVTHFALLIPDTLPPVPTVRPPFPQVRDLMPNLTHFEIRVDASMTSMETGMVELLKGLPRLKSVAFGQYQFTTAVAECLSNLADIIAVDVGCHYYRGESEDIHDFCPVLREGAFPALTTLLFDAQFHDARKFLAALSLSTKLKTLCVTSPELETEGDVKNLVACIAKECPNVATLTIRSFIDPRLSELLADHGRINIQTIEPLFSNKNLTSLTFAHQHPINLHSSDLEAISRAWPLLHTLRLNSAPGHFMASNLTFEALVPFAQNCPNLHTLGLFMDASNPGAVSMAQNIRFQSLETLDVGLSVIGDEGLVVQFLQQIFPPNAKCVVSSGVTWDELRVSTRDRAVMLCHGRINRWIKVDGILQGLGLARYYTAEALAAFYTYDV